MFTTFSFPVAGQEFVDQSAHLDLVELCEITVTEHLVADRFHNLDFNSAVVYDLEHKIPLLV
jgi:hypothetical protein